MKIKYRNSDGQLLMACINSNGDDFITIPFDESIHTLITVEDNTNYLEYWKYKYIDNEITEPEAYSFIPESMMMSSMSIEEPKKSPSKNTSRKKKK